MADVYMKAILIVVLAVAAGIASAAEYPDVSLNQLLTAEQRAAIGSDSMTAPQREALRRALIDAFGAGYAGAKKEATQAEVEVESGVIEAQISDAFEGWDGETIVKLTNGQIWQQSTYYYEYRYAYRPNVMIYNDGGRTMMKVEGTRQAVSVRRLQ